MSEHESQPDWESFIEAAYDAADRHGLSIKELAAELAARPVSYVLNWRPSLQTWIKPFWRWQFAHTQKALRDIEPTELTDNHPWVIKAEALVSEWEFGWSSLNAEQRQTVRKQVIMCSSYMQTIPRAFRTRHIGQSRGQVVFKRLGNEAALILKLGCLVLSGLAVWSYLLSVRSAIKSSCLSCDALVLMQLAGLCAALAWGCYREGPRRRAVEQHFQMLGIPGV